MYSLEASLRERARKKGGSLDIVSSKPKKVFSPSVPLPQTPAFPAWKGLDGVVRERQTLLTQLKKDSWQQNAKRAWRKGELFFRRVRRVVAALTPQLAPHKMLYGSIVGGIAFGMVSMAFIEHFFGPGVFARSEAPAITLEQQNVVADASEESDMPQEMNYDPEQDVFFEYFGEVTKEKYEQSIRDMVKGYPIEAMLPYIFQQDRLTAAFLIGIAKKESNWGKRIPVLDGQDCYNYWGYRGVRRMMGTGGHTCFNSRADAVKTVAARLNTLINSEKLDTPDKMIVWKCGFSCQGHSRESVKKWISDVDMYFSQLSDE
jgi:hypothetical protein